MKLFFDTETTGLVDFKAPATAEHQPHLVQLGAVLVDDDRSVVCSVGKIVRPAGWEVPEDAAKIHGITTEKAREVGWSASRVLRDFSYMAHSADEIIGHNVPFDMMVMETAFSRHSIPALFFDNPNTFCTMRAATPIMKLPGRYGYRRPHLYEAYKFFTGKDLVGAHDALVDANATIEVYWAIKDLEAQEG